MDLLAEISHLHEVGRCREALERLKELPVGRQRTETEMMRADLLVSAGDLDEARRIVEQIQTGRKLDDATSGHIEFILARITADAGEFESNRVHLQRALASAERTQDLRLICTAQLRLLSLIADREGPDAAASLLGSLRLNILRLGEPAMTAALHIFVAEIEGKRGLLRKAIHHIDLAQALLTNSPNRWLEAFVLNNRLVFSILQNDLDQAQVDGMAALEVSRDCGVLGAIQRCVNNLSRMHLSLGDIESAIQALERAASLSHESSDHGSSVLDNIARVRLMQGRYEDAFTLLAKVDITNRVPTRSGGYTHRHSLLTQSEVLLRLERLDESDACLHRVLALARQSGDQVLAAYATLLHAEVLLRLGRHDAAWQTLTSAVPSLSQQPFDVFALYERVVACALLHAGDRDAAERHFERSRRIYENLQNKPAIIELSRSWHSAENLAPVASVSTIERPERHASNVLQNVASMLLHHGKPDLVALDLVSVLSDAGCVVSAEAVARDQTGVSRPLAGFGPAAVDADTQTLSLGTSRNRAITVTVRPKRDLESQAALNSLTLLLGTVRELELARAEREERLTLWPADEFDETLSGAVVGGKMRELLAYAKRIAQTNISVLITGESGTGKEVLARAIHNFSPRARKPFVPFNCTAVPRELLESQMFGYRRGAFTGAERDHAGVIRSAKDGTLFLDEIGELGLDLQPKLLRFLESGEINPLGEPSPFHVDVRIVAATNANLDQLVLDGKFREDLFYRLNVLPLLIPPLRERRDEIPELVNYFVARAAAEFKKGRIRVADDTLELLILYSWPGNIRQLQNELRRMVALIDADSVLRPTALSKTLRGPARHAPRNQGLEIAVPLTDKLNPTLARIEKEMIKTALKAADGKVEVAARALGISRKGLYLKRQRLGL